MSGKQPKCVAKCENNPEPASQKTIEKKKIRAAMFFDGTLNNRTNTEERLYFLAGRGSPSYQKFGEAESSYMNDYSNVVFLHKYAETKPQDKDNICLKIYTEGIGTINKQGDGLGGFAFGDYGTGIRTKVEIGIDECIKQIKNVIGAPKEGLVIDEVRLESFGFSRGLQPQDILLMSHLTALQKWSERRL